DCFVAAYEYLFKITEKHAAPNNFALVHGHAFHLSHDCDLNCHAWVEEGEIVYEVSNGMLLTFTRNEYYARLKITNVERYVRNDALINNLMYCHYGPWPQPVDRVRQSNAHNQTVLEY